MTGQDLLNRAKMARRITTDAFNDEIIALLNTALADLGVAGVEVPEGSDDLISTAAVTYFLAHFGNIPKDEYERHKASYDEQKAQLSMCTDYTTWER